MLIARRKFMTAAAAMTVLAGCKSVGGLGTLLRDGLMREVTEDFEELLYSPDRLAPDLPISDLTPEKDIPSFFRSPSVPIAPTNWTLKVGGLVQHPLILRLDQLHGMPTTAMRVPLYCVNGWSVVAAWRGVRLSEIAKLAGPDRLARYVEFRSFDAGYFSGWDLASAMHPQTILAYEMNGRPLEANHGAPLRLFSAIKLGYKNVKYLSEINFLPNRVAGDQELNYQWFGGL